MPQGWLPSAPDQRTFADQIGRTLSDLNRPDLPDFAQQYLQDAIRYFQRKPFFFNQTDNSPTATWAAGTYYTQGACLQVSSPAPLFVVTDPGWMANTLFAVGQSFVDTNGNVQLCVVAGLSGATVPTWSTGAWEDTLDNTIVWVLTSQTATQVLAVVNLTPGISGATPPQFTQSVYTPPTTLTSPPVFTPGVGTTPDSGCLWATVGPWQTGIYTQLSTVPSQNQYVPPLDYTTPVRIEVTWSANLRIGMTKLAYDELRDYDVIRPTPPTTYPSYWAWFQQQIYLWPYPVSFYPMTLSYNTAPALPINAGDSNFWTTQAEGLIRYWAEGRINEVVLQDLEASQRCFALAQQELNTLVSQRIQQDSTGEDAGIPAATW